MDLLQLEHFLAVSEEGTFTRAAERVYRTQSAVSQSIKKLEDEIGSPVFSRGNDVGLTEAGKVMLDVARRMLKLRDDATRQVEALKNLSTGSLSIGAHEAAAVYLLPTPLRSYLRIFPDIKVGIYRTRLEEVPKQVLDHELDIGFIKENSPLHGLQVVEVHSDEMILIAAPEHPFASRHDVHIKDLGAEPFILHHQCSTTMQKILRLFEEHHTTCRVVAELWSFENVKTFVREGVGLAIVPGVVARHELSNKSLVRIHVPEINMERRMLMIYRDQGYVSEPARQLINLVKQFSADSAGSRNQNTAMLNGKGRLRKIVPA